MFKRINLGSRGFHGLDRIRPNVRIKLIARLSAADVEVKISEKYFLVFSITHQIGQRRLLYFFKGKVRNNIPQKTPHPVLHLKDRDYIVLDLCSYCLRGSQSALVAPHQTGFVFLLEVFSLTFTLFRGSSLKLVQGFWGSRPGLS